MEDITVEKKESLLETVNEILKIEDCTLNTNRKETESWDSLAHVMLIAEIESKFNISIPFEEIGNIEKVNDFFKYIG